MSDRYDQLLPPYVISAVKSMPRRWANALFLQLDGIDDNFGVEGADGLTVAEHTGAFLAQVETIAAAIGRTLHDSDSMLEADVESAMANACSGPPAGPDALASIEALMEQLGNRLDALSSSDWSRTAMAPGGPVSIDSLAKGAVRVASERLRAVEGAVGAEP